LTERKKTAKSRRYLLRHSGNGYLMAKIAIPRLELAAGMLGNSGRTATTEAANASMRTHGHSAPAEIHGVETRTPKRTSSPFRRKAAARAMTISPAASPVRASAKPRFVTPTVHGAKLDAPVLDHLDAVSGVGI